jgi:energy-coupling factor transporter ATP-binding protein EcfA2
MVLGYGMSRIADYNPLVAIKIPGVPGEIKTTGLVVIVGPNSSGKTLLLRDIENILTGNESKPIVCQDALLARPDDLGALLDDLLTNKLLEKKGQRLVTARPHLGRAMLDNKEYEVDKLASLYNAFTTGWTAGSKIDFLTFLGRLALTSLFLENRPTLYQAQPRFEQYSQAPQNDLQALSLDGNAQDKLAEETSGVCGNVVWLDIATRQGQLGLRVSGNSKPPVLKARYIPGEADKYRIIDDEGHGFKSYIGIAIALLLGRRPVCLIDEPELCLHPPQA